MNLNRSSDRLDEGGEYFETRSGRLRKMDKNVRCTLFLDRPCRIVTNASNIKPDAHRSGFRIPLDAVTADCLYCDKRVDQVIGELDDYEQIRKECIDLLIAQCADPLDMTSPVVK